MHFYKSFYTNFQRTDLENFVSIKTSKHMGMHGNGEASGAAAGSKFYLNLG